MTQECGALGGKCPEGPKRHHKCKREHKRVRGQGSTHEQHECKYCGSTFT